MKRRLPIGLCLGLAACGMDWRAQQMRVAEEKIRAEVNDPAAQFRQVQLTGDQATGQTCGFVIPRKSSGVSGEPARFIVYIDGSAGPWVEKSEGRAVISQQRFDMAWQWDCVNEGWKAA
jgi:hypothetical protein